MELAARLDEVTTLAARHVGPDDAVSGVIATEPVPGERVYLCSIDGADGYRSWLAVREDGSAVTDRAELRAAISIAALCEVAADAAGGGDVPSLIERLEEIRAREAPEGIEGAIAAARALEEAVGEPPQVASAARLDALGAATRRLEQELDPIAPSPFSAAVKAAQGAVAELQREIEAGYRLPLV